MDVNEQILRRLGLHNALKECSEKDLHDALCSGDERKRKRMAIKVMHEIWTGFPGLGCPPVLESLYEEEEQRTLYDGYRDHIVHSLQVYLLGLDMLYALPQLRHRLEGVGTGFANLKRRWAVVALGHDQGYVIAAASDARTPPSLKELLDDPLLGLQGINRGVVAQIKKYRDFDPGPTEFIENLTEYQNIAILKSLATKLPDELFGEDPDALEKFYRFKEKSGFKGPDHGIASALIIQQMHRRLCQLFGSIQWKKISSQHVSPVIVRQLQETAKETENSQADIAVASQAIALHNINSSLKKNELDVAAGVFGLDLSRFRLSLSKTPLAWLLGFCDTLQCWNRPVVIPNTEGEKTFIEASEISIDYRNDYMWLTFHNEALEVQASRPSPYWKHRQEMAQLLNENDLGFLLQGPPPKDIINDDTEEEDGTSLLSAEVRVRHQFNYALMGEISSKSFSRDEFLFKVGSELRAFPDVEPVCVLYTGGSVGMVPKDPLDPKSPLVTEKLCKVIPYLKNLDRLPFDVHFYEMPTPLDSSNILPEDWVEIGSIIEMVYESYQGFVVLHGTDTMTYTASALSMMFDDLTKPIILTGAERPLGQPETDAEYNIMRSLRLAAPSTIDHRVVPEVCIFFGNRLLRGNRAKKTHALDFNGFDSPNYPHIGKVEDKISIFLPHIRDGVFKRRVKRTRFNKELDERVAIFEVFPNEISCLDTLEYLLLKSNKINGLILKTYGTGNAPTNPEAFLGHMQTARDQGKIVVNLTHCLTGEVEVRLFETNARLFEQGVINGGDMTVEAAYTKLMVLMGRYRHFDEQNNVFYDHGAIKKEMQRNLRGELLYSAHTLVYPDHNVDIISLDKGSFLGSPKSIGDIDPDEVHHAYVRVSGLRVEANPETEITIEIYVNLPNVRKVESKDRKNHHFVAQVTRVWEEQEDGITFNLDATDKVKALALGASDQPISMQLITWERYFMTIENFELAIFTENVKG